MRLSSHEQGVDDRLRTHHVGSLSRYSLIPIVIAQLNELNDDASFNVIMSGWGGATWLRELVGTTAMMKILAQGRVYGAAEALQVGLIDKIANEGETVEETAIHLLKELHAFPKDFRREPQLPIDSRSQRAGL